MTNDVQPNARILGRLRAVEGKSSVLMQDRFATDVDDLWSALTEPDRLARWLGRVSGELRVGGQFSAEFFASGWEGIGRVVECEPPLRFLITTSATGEDEEQTVEATLRTDDDHTVLVIEERGMPLDQLAAYGAGVQVHVEDLAAHLAGGERCDAQTRWSELISGYRALAREGS